MLVTQIWGVRVIQINNLHNYDVCKMWFNNLVKEVEQVFLTHLFYREWNWNTEGKATYFRLLFDSLLHIMF